MTDRSSYGPVRRLSPVSADNRKPYSRTGLKGVLGTLDLNSGDVAMLTAPDSPYYPFHVETPQLEAPTQNHPIAPDGPRDIAGFPTYEQYQRIEEEYLSSLSERKQPKALISQALFDKVFAVLQNGSEDRASTAQFRFWVRKMFVLVYPQTSFVSRGGTSNNNAGPGQSQAGGAQSTDPVVLHDKRPVAIREQLYEVLCYCHAVARHGGRDKTCATLRLHYSWVPKELTAKFVKACPTCTLKRSGNPDLLSQFGQAVQQAQAQSQSQSHPPYAPPTLPVEPGLHLFPGGPNDSPPSLSFIVGSAAGCCDDAGAGGSFAPSIFTTPDLSVYPSPTLSTGSFGPMTPSPYLPSGLFGYPAMFDPGHGSLSSVAGWDPSPFSPCVPMYAEDLRTGITGKQVRPVSAEGVIDMRAFGMQLHLPTPQAVRAMRTRVHNWGSGSGSDAGRDSDSHGGGCGVVGTPCPVDTGNIDPVLLTEEGYPPLNLVGPPVLHTPVAVAVASTDMDADADADGDTDMDIDTETPAGTANSRPHFLKFPATWETRTPVVSISMGSGGEAGFAGPSSPLSPADSPHPTPTPTPTPTLTPTPSHTMMLAMPTPMPFPVFTVAATAPGVAALGTRMMGQGAMGVRTAWMERAVSLGPGADVDVDIEDAVPVEGPPRLRIEHARWDSLEAWLVHSDSMDDDAAAASDDMA